MNFRAGRPNWALTWNEMKGNFANFVMAVDRKKLVGRDGNRSLQFQETCLELDHRIFVSTWWGRVSLLQIRKCSFEWMKTSKTNSLISEGFVLKTFILNKHWIPSNDNRNRKNYNFFLVKLILYSRILWFSINLIF